jgi:hypothetical protein
VRPGLEEPPFELGKELAEAADPEEGLVGAIPPGCPSVLAAEPAAEEKLV